MGEVYLSRAGRLFKERLDVAIPQGQEVTSSPKFPSIRFPKQAEFADMRVPRPMTYNREKILPCHALNFASTQREYQPQTFTALLSTY
jgi:hypothetical protein